jgi:hypothetical protein
VIKETENHKTGKAIIQKSLWELEIQKFQNRINKTSQDLCLREENLNYLDFRPLS